MGHTRLGNLPKTQRWTHVVGTIKDSGADVGHVASVTIEAAEAGLQRAARDQGFAQTFWLLTQVTLAARRDDFVASLRASGLTLPNQPTLFDLLGSFSDCVDAKIRGWGGRSDFGEIAQLSAQETLASLCGSQIGTLFGTPTEDLQKALKAFSTTNTFGALAHTFFATFTSRYLKSFLSRELSNHVGSGRRFADLSQHTKFNKALDLHCRQTAQIIQAFAGSWYSQTEFETGITSEKARDFVHVALKKIRSELQRERQDRGA